MEVLILSISCAVSVIAFVFSLIALKAADPLELRRISAFSSGTARELTNKLEDLERVQVPRMEAQCEALLDRAELRFEGAEAKRKSVAARERHIGGDHSGNGSGDPFTDPALWESLPDSEKKAAIERAHRSR